MNHDSEDGCLQKAGFQQSGKGVRSLVKSQKREELVER